MDLLQLFEGQKQLDEGCAEGHYPFRSLYLFPSENPFRRFVFRSITSFAYQSVSWSAAVMACLSMGINALPVSATSGPYSTIEFCSYAFLAIEIILKCVAFGFAEKANSFIRGSAFNVIDFLCSLSYWIEFCLPSPYNAELTLRPLRFFRHLAPPRPAVPCWVLTLVSAPCGLDMCVWRPPGSCFRSRTSRSLRVSLPSSSLSNLRYTPHSEPET